MTDIIRLGDAVNRSPEVAAVQAAFPGTEITGVAGIGGMDFTPPSKEAFGVAFQGVIDEAMEAAQTGQGKRDYLGGSRLGEECQRRLGYEYTHTPKDEGKDFKGPTLRIFDRGHDGEDRVAQYMRLAGFELLTEKPSGGQFGFYTANDPETGHARIRGHLDGVITGGPAFMGPFPMAYPCLWENKVLGDKGFKDVIAKGVERSKPIYYAQVQLYMGYMGLTDHPALFTVMNANTGHLHAELVPFIAQAAQAASDRGVRVVSARSPEELPRCAKDATDFRCKFCDYAVRCHSTPSTPAPAVAFGWSK